MFLLLDEGFGVGDKRFINECEYNRRN